jgi:hypothetical protein
MLPLNHTSGSRKPIAIPVVYPPRCAKLPGSILVGKIDQWFFKTDESGVVLIMNLTDPLEAHELLEQLPLGRAGMMGLWPYS